MGEKLGTIIELPDGRIGTVVFNGLSGVGIRWGRLEVTEEIRELYRGSTADLFTGFDDADPRWKDWEPEAMLRDGHLQGFFTLPCVGGTYEVIEDGITL